MLETFEDYVRELTEPTGKTLEYENGEPFFVWADPLLQRLREAVVADANGGGGGGGFESRLPLDPDAADLLIRIERESNRLFYAVTREKAVGPVEVTVRGWAKRVNRDLPVVFKHGDELTTRSPFEIVQFWHHTVTSYFDSPKEVPLRETVCPECGASKTAGPGGSEDYVLHLRKDRVSGLVLDAFCKCCSHRWERGELVELATSLDLFGTRVELH